MAYWSSYVADPTLGVMGSQPITRFIAWGQQTTASLASLRPHSTWSVPGESQGSS